MAIVLLILRATVIIYLCLFISVSLADNSNSSVPEFDTLRSINLTKSGNFTKVRFEVLGKNIRQNLRVKTTTVKAEKNTLCKEDLNYPVYEVSFNSTSAVYEISLPRNATGEFYLCLQHENWDRQKGISKVQLNTFNKWIHQGLDVVIKVVSDMTVRTFPYHQKENDEFQVTTLRLEKHEKSAEFDEEGIPTVLADTEHIIRIFGRGFVENMTITFTDKKITPDKSCQFPKSGTEFQVISGSFSTETARVKIILPPMGDAETLYVCAKESNKALFVHQGDAAWLQIRSYQDALPLSFNIIVALICLMFSSLFSGLNLGLMSLDMTDLAILCNAGTPREQKFARAIQPIRNRGNYLLCSILIGNVLVNSIFTILLNVLTSGSVSVIASTIVIILIGEITPQAICSRHGLVIGAKTIYITKILMFITFPLSYPVSKFLDCILGKEVGHVYNRETLKELVNVTTDRNELDKHEVNIISGALELHKKTVADVMTKIEDVFMLDYETTLDFKTLSEMVKSGYSRIPVYKGSRQNIVAVLHIKNLIFVEPKDNIPLKVLCQFYQNPYSSVLEDVTLDVMFKTFKQGEMGHLASVHRVGNNDEAESLCQTIGIVTLEDVIEELIQSEIVDETDVFTDNRSKRKRSSTRRHDFSVFAERKNEENGINISPQLILAAYQFLSVSVKQFFPSVVSRTILERLLRQDIVFRIKKNKEWRTDPANIIYQEGKNSDCFVLILEGRVEVTIGKENLIFEAGPFTYFGAQYFNQSVRVADSLLATPTSSLGKLISQNSDAMLHHTFYPDYTVRAKTDVTYLRINGSLYLAATIATAMEHSQPDLAHAIKDQFDKEVVNLLNSKNLHQLQGTNLTPSCSNSNSSYRLNEKGNDASIISSPTDKSYLGKNKNLSPLD